MSQAKDNEWSLYILQCDAKLYTGIALDPIKRFKEHLSKSSRSARFTRTASHIELIYSVKLGEKAIAMRAERKIKTLPRKKKDFIVTQQLGCEELLAYLNL